MVTLVALLGSLLAVISPPQAAHAEVTGTGGQYVPMPDNARVFAGGTTAGVFKTVKVNGVDGLPATGIGAVSVLVTVADAATQGQLVGRPNAADPGHAADDLRHRCDREHFEHGAPRGR